MAAQSGIESAQNLQTGQFNLASAQSNAVNNAISQTLQLPDDQLKDGVVNATQDLVRRGVIPVDRAMQSLLTLPSDPAQLRTRLKTLWTGTLPGARRWSYRPLPARLVRPP
jgi:hypothetical protein